MSRQELRNRRPPFTCAGHPMNAAPRRAWDALPLVQVVTLATISLIAARILWGAL